MKIKLILLAALSFTYQMNAQTIEKSSIDSGGSLSVNGNIEMIYSIGKTNLQEFNEGNIILSEGFVSGNLLDFALNTEDVTNTVFKISLFPNPTINMFQISGLKEKVDLVMYDSAGKEVLRKRNYLNGKINIEQMSSGVYLVKISHATSSAIKRVVKN